MPADPGGYERVELREYESLEKRITAEQAMSIASTGMVTVRRAWTPGSFEITAGPVVGALQLVEGLELRVIPKVPVRRVIYLLAHAAGLATWDERLLQLHEDTTIDVALAEAFTVAAERALRQGPHSAYYTVQADLQELRGRLNANEQRRRFGLPVPIAVIYDDYGTDIAENQLLAGAALQLQRLPGLPADLHRRLRRISRSLDAVRPASRGDARTPVHYTRLNDHYRGGVALARAVLVGATFDVSTGRRTATGFTVSMPGLFERFLEAALTEALERRHAGRLYPKRPEYLDRGHLAQIEPDLTWIVDGTPSVVIDAKYKTLVNGKPSEDDLYQLITYCLALGVSQAYLVHATTPAAPLAMAMCMSDIVVHAVGLNLAAPLADLRSQIWALADFIAASSRPANISAQALSAQHRV